MSKTEETTTEEKEAPDGPILDLSDAAVKKMIKAAKTRGFVTHEELNRSCRARNSIPSRSKT